MLTQNSTNDNRSGRILKYAPLFLWIAFIFLMSGNAGAFSETSRFIRPILEFLFPGASTETLRLFHVYIRKAAHFTEYAVLAIFAARALRGASFQTRRLTRIAAVILIVLIIAAADEIGQSFRILRTGSFWDALIDLSGGATAAILVEIFRRPHS